MKSPVHPFGTDQRAIADGLHGWTRRPGCHRASPAGGAGEATRQEVAQCRSDRYRGPERNDAANDDIGTESISYYNRGMMGYSDAEHRPHCQGRCIFHRITTASSPAPPAAPCSSTDPARFRTGMTKVGIPRHRKDGGKPT